MGQYYIIANVDKKEYIRTYDFGDLAKLMEFAYPGNPGTVTAALCILLADGNGLGSGDLHSSNPIIGSWKYNRVVVAGDYADPNPEFSAEKNVYTLAYEDPTWRNVSMDVLCAMVDDSYFAEQFAEDLLESYFCVSNAGIVAMAIAHKDKQYYTNRFPKLAKKAEAFFEALYPGKSSNYYKVINGIAKHNEMPSERVCCIEESIADDPEEDQKPQPKVLTKLRACGKM